MAIPLSKCLDPFKVFTTLQKGDTIDVQGESAPETYCKAMPTSLTRRMVGVVYPSDSKKEINNFVTFFKARIEELKKALDSEGTLNNYTYHYLHTIRTGIDLLSKTHYDAATSYTIRFFNRMSSKDQQWGDAAQEILTQFDTHILNSCVNASAPLFASLREKDEAGEVEKQMREFHIIESENNTWAKADELTREIQLQFNQLAEGDIDQEAVLIAMEMEELLLSLQKENKHISSVKAIEILAYIQGEKKGQEPVEKLFTLLTSLRQEAGDREGLFLMLRANMGPHVLKKGMTKAIIHDLCLRVQKMNGDVRKLIFFTLEMSLDWDATPGEKEPFSELFKRMKVSGLNSEDLARLRFFSKFEELGIDLKHKRAALFLLNACVDAGRNKLLPQINLLRFTDGDRKLEYMCAVIKGTLPSLPEMAAVRTDSSDKDKLQ